MSLVWVFCISSYDYLIFFIGCVGGVGWGGGGRGVVCPDCSTVCASVSKLYLFGYESF